MYDTRSDLFQSSRAVIHITQSGSHAVEAETSIYGSTRVSLIAGLDFHRNMGGLDFN